MMRKTTLFFLAFCLAGRILADVRLDENFDDNTFSNGSLPNSVKTYSASAPPNSFVITSEQAESAPRSLMVDRPGASGFVNLKLSRPVLPGYDFQISFSLKIADGGLGSLFLYDGIHYATPLGALLLKNNNLLGNQGKDQWRQCADLPFVVNAWNNIVMDFSAQNHLYRIGLVQDGKIIFSQETFPYPANAPLVELRFFNSLPQGNRYYIDNIKVSAEDTPPQASRFNEIKNATNSSPDIPGDELPKLADGDLKTPLPSSKSGQKVTLNFDLKEAVELGGMRVVAIPGSELKLISIRAYDQLGHWSTLAENISGKEIIQLEFPPHPRTSKLALVLQSNRNASLCEVEFFAPLAKTKQELNKLFERKVSGEFRLAVYDTQYPNQQKADLALINHTDAELPVKLTLTERKTAKTVAAEQKIILVPGENHTEFSLKNLPNGEYIATISEIVDNQNAGHIKRLLRHSTSPATTIQPLSDLTGKKIFFPDDFYLETHENITFTPVQAARYPVKQGTSEDENYIVYGEALFLDNDDNICINYYTVNRLWQVASRKNYHAVASGTDMTAWQHGEGSGTPGANHRNSLYEDVPAKAQPDWSPKPVAGKLTYRFYDPEKDGQVNLNQVAFVWVNPAESGTIAHQKYDWKIVHPAPATTWPIWYKDNGEALLLRKTPLVLSYGVDDGSGFEHPDSGSDLGFGQWLSDDGKILSYARGRHLLRYPPYVARYDNIWNLARIVSVWSTEDGINYNRTYLGVPDVTDPVADQHYGGLQIRLPGSDGLRVAFLNDYSALHQQMTVVLAYSHDGFRWTRFPGKAPFLDNGTPDDWRNGSSYLSSQAVEKDGKIYQLIPWAQKGYHFQSELTLASRNMDHFTTQYLKERMEPRHLNEWPYFQTRFDGSWEKIAENTRNCYTSMGVAVYRKDGFFRMEAPQGGGKFLTRPIRAQGTLRINAKINPGGLLRLALVNRQNQVIDQCEVEFNAPVDRIDLPVFDKLPAEEFSVRGEISNAELYTLDFTNQP